MESWISWLARTFSPQPPGKPPEDFWWCDNCGINCCNLYIYCGLWQCFCNKKTTNQSTTSVQLVWSLKTCPIFSLLYLSHYNRADDSSQHLGKHVDSSYIIHLNTDEHCRKSRRRWPATTHMIRHGDSPKKDFFRLISRSSKCPSFPRCGKISEYSREVVKVDALLSYYPPQSLTKRITVIGI